jgi:hypothetical protein
MTIRFATILLLLAALLAALAIIGFRIGVVDFPDGNNVLVNGGFEGTLTPNCSQSFTNQCNAGDRPPYPGLEGMPPAALTSVPGWTVVAATPAPDKQNVLWMDQDNQFVGDIASDRPEGGHNFIDLSGFTDLFVAGSSGGMRQTFTTKAGKKYMLFFDIGVFNDSAQPKFSGPITVVASIDNQPLSPCGPYNPTEPGPHWQTCKNQFTAATESTTLTIVAIAGQSFIGLDKVSVQCIAPLGRPGFC